MDDVLIAAIIGIAFVTLGVWGALTKRISLVFSRRRRFLTPRVLFFRFTLTGARAILFSYISLFVGLGILGLSIYIFAANNEEMVRSGILTVVIVAGTGIIILMFLLELFIESLVAIQNSARKK